jgi:hypothetical protein
VSPLQRASAEFCGAAAAAFDALIDVSAFIFTLGYIDHITRGPCRHCHR